MVSIREVNYLDATVFPNRSNVITETVLVIKKSKDNSDSSSILCYLLGCSRWKEQISQHSSDQFLIIILDITGGIQNERARKRKRL